MKKLLIGILVVAALYVGVTSWMEKEASDAVASATQLYKARKYEDALAVLKRVEWFPNTDSAPEAEALKAKIQKAKDATDRQQQEDALQQIEERRQEEAERRQEQFGND